MTKQEEPKKNGGGLKVIIGKSKFIIDSKNLSKEDLDILNNSKASDEDKLLIALKHSNGKGKKEHKNEKETFIIPFSYKNNKGDIVEIMMDHKTIFYIDGKKYETKKVTKKNNKGLITATEFGTTNEIELSSDSFFEEYQNKKIRFEDSPTIVAPATLPTTIDSKKPVATKVTTPAVTNKSPLINMEKTELNEFAIEAKDSLNKNDITIKKNEKIYKKEERGFVEYTIEKIEKLKGKKTPTVTLKDPSGKEKVISTKEFIDEYKDEKIKILISDEDYKQFITEKKKYIKKIKPLPSPILATKAFVIPPRINPATATINKPALTTISKIVKNTPTKPIGINKFVPGSRNETIKNIGDLLKIGVDRVVIHGKDIKNKDGEKETVISPDTDTLGALYLLNNSFDPNKKSNIKYNEGAFTETVQKGKKSEAKNNEVVLYVDVGRENLSIKIDGKTKNIFVDHHGEKTKRQTSATSMIFEILNKNGLLKEKPIWMNSFVDFIDNVDNLLYLDKKNKDNEKIFDEKYFLNTWPYSLQGIYDQIPFKALTSIFEKYPNRNPNKPFTREEIMGEIGNIKINETETLANICKKRKGQVDFSIKRVKDAISSAEKRGIKTENKTLGKFIYHDFIKYDGEKKLINIIPNHLAFLTTKSLGYDSFVSYSKTKKNFFVNSATKDLTKIHEKINKILSDTQLIRGVFIFPPKNYSEIDETLTEEQFRECLDIETIPIKNSKKEEEIKTKEIKKEEEKEPTKEIEYTEDYLERMIAKYEGRPVLQNIFLKKLAEMEIKNGKKKEEPKKEKSVEEKKKELPKINEIEIKKLSDEFTASRERYIIEYKKSLESKKSTTMVGRWFNKIHDSIFGAKIAENEISFNLKKSKEDWDNASEKYQKLLQDKYRAEYLVNNNNETEADRYAKAKILGEVVLKNIETTRNADAEKWPPEKKTIMGKMWEAWRKTSKTKKVLLSCGIFATAGLLGGMAMGALMTGVTWKVTRSLFTAQAAHLVDRSYKKDENKKTESLDSLRTEFIEGTMDAKTYKDKYEIIIEQEKKANRKRLLIKTGIAFAIGAGTMVATEIYDNLHQVETPVGGAVIKEPGVTPIHTPEQEHFSSDAIIRKNEGIEHAFRRQIENDPALKAYFDGKDSGVASHIAAQKLGYVDGHGGEVRVAMPGVGYKLEVDPNGKLVTYEIDGHGKIIDTNHHEGDNFESTPDKHEYGYDKSPENTNIYNNSTETTEESVEEPTDEETESDTETNINELPFDDQVAIRVRTDIDNYFTKHTGLTTIAGPDTETWKTLSNTDSWNFMKKLTSNGYDDPQIYSFGEYFHRLANKYDLTDESSLKGKTVAEMFETLESKAQTDGYK